MSDDTIESLRHEETLLQNDIDAVDRELRDLYNANKRNLEHHPAIEAYKQRRIELFRQLSKIQQKLHTYSQPH